MKVVIFMLMLFLGLNGVAQESYNNCNAALELCPYQVNQVSNYGANKTFCPGCEDDFSYCFSSHNSIWFTFTTNTLGGDVTVSFSNLVFATGLGQDDAIQATMLEATIPCNADSYTPIGNCISDGMTDFALTATGLLPNTVYYIVVNGDLSGAGITSAAECVFDISVSGSAIDRSASGVVIESSSENICQSDMYTANAIVFDCPDNGDFKWFINGVLAAVTSDHYFQSSSIQNGDIISVETSCYTLCSEIISNQSNPISVYSFSVDAGVDQTIEPGQTALLVGTTSAPVHYWTPSYNISSTSSLSTVVSPEETTIYTLTAEKNGCTSQDFVTIYVQEELIIPTTFSPNDDDINDKWIISGVEQYPNCYVRIFDRWGQEVYQSNGYTDAKAWDGTINSNPAAEGVYFYVVKLRDDENEEFKGSITLIR